MKVKNDGMILLPTIIISGMLLSLALALTKIVSNELQFSTDLLMAERSYFAAESGVEIALLSLKEHPINYVNMTQDLANTSTATILVKNSEKSFSFLLEEKEALRWQLGIDTNDNMERDIKLVRDFEIEQTDGDFRDLQWKIQCENADKVTEMIQARAQDDDDSDNIIDEQDTGTYDDGEATHLNTTIEDFLYPLENDALCFISLTNFGEDVIKGIVSTTTEEGTDEKTMAPAQTYIRAIGKARGREKIIEFEYRKKNLNPFFDFGLLHKN